MQHLNNSAPARQFFKPLTNGLHNRSTAASTASYFAPVSQQSLKNKDIAITNSPKVSIVQEQHNNSEKLGSLHVKLHNEAEKIRKWKVQTEIELKQKDKKLQEATHTIDSLRKSILDIQLQNENLSLKLQEELDNREEIMLKIDSTRDMCNLLKDHTLVVEDRLQLCESDRTELKYVEKEHVKQLEELSLKFRDLEITSNKNKNDMLNALKNEQEEKEKMKQEFDEQLSESNEKIDDLRNQCRINEKHIQVATDEVQQKIREVAALQENNDDLMTTRQILNGMLSSLENEHKKVCEDFQQVKDEKEKLMQSLRDLNQKMNDHIISRDQLARNFDATESAYMIKVETLTSKIEGLQNELETCKSKLSECQAAYSKAQTTIEELKSSKDLLILERTDACERIKSQEASLENMSKAVFKLEKDVSKAEEGLTVKSEIISSLNEQVQQLQVNLESVNKKVKEAEDQEKLLNQEIETLGESLSTESMERYKLLQEQSAAKTEKKQLELELTKKEEELKSVAADLEQSKQNEEQTQNKLAEVFYEVGQLKSTVSSLEETLKEQADKNESLLQGELSTNKSLEDELEKKSRVLEEHGIKIKTMKDDMTSKNKQIKELEREVKGLKSKLASQNKSSSALEDECEELKAEIEKEQELQNQLEEDVKATQAELEKQITATNDANKEIKTLKSRLTTQTKQSKALEDKYNKLTGNLGNEKEAQKKLIEDLDVMKETNDKQKEENEDLQKKIKKLEKESSQAMREKGAVQARFDRDISEMTATLDKYQKESQKMLQTKQHELDALRTEVTSRQQLTADGKKKEIEEARKESEMLKSLLEKAESEKIQMQEELNVHSERLKSIDTDVSAKDKEIKRLLEEVNELKSSTVRLEEEKEKLSADIQKEKQVPVPSTPRISTHRGNAVQPFTPKSHITTPRMHVAATPQQTQYEPAPSRTPQTSILKTVNSAVRKRRVMFASDDDGDSSGSSQELMEIEVSEIEKRLKTPKPKQCVTPLVVRPSPKTYSGSGTKRSTPSRTPLVPVPRGMAPSSEKQKKMKRDDENEEFTKFKKLYPQQRALLNDADMKKKKMTNKISNVKSTPSRTTSKFFKSSPKERKRSKVSSKKEELAWFDSDSIFGFGSED